MPVPDPGPDRWSAWLLAQRHGGDPARRAEVLARVRAIADEVLAHSGLAGGATVADIGCGDGLLGLTALERADALDVVFVDVSAALLAAARRAAEERGVAARCRFVAAAVEDLAGLADASIDVAMTRSVLAYVADKAAAFASLARVLRPGGRLSIAEPIFQDLAFGQIAFKRRLDAGELGLAGEDLALLHRWRRSAFPDTLEALRENPLTAFGERDLVGHARRAGFVDVHLRLHLDDVPASPIAWEAALRTALLPGAPTLAEVLREAFTPAERTRFEQRFRPLFERGELAAETSVTAYLWATRA